MLLLEDPTHVDDAVEVRPVRSEPPHRRALGVRELIHQRAQALAAGIGEDVDAPGAVCPGGVAELHRLGIREANHRGRVEALADGEALGKPLVRRLGGQSGRWRVLRRHPGRVAARHDEIALQLRRVDTAGLRMRRVLRRRAHDLRPFLVEVDQALRDGVPLRRVGAQQFGLGTPLEHGGELPAEIVGVLHGHVHALAGLGAVRVAGVAGNEHARQAGPGLIRRDVVEPVGDALPHLVDGEPRHASHVERVRVEHTLGGLDDLVLRDEPERIAVGRVDLTEVDVEPHHVAALPRDQQDVAVVGGLDRCLEPDVREVGDREHVDDAPSVVGEVAARHGPDRVPHEAACAIAAHDVFRADLLLLASPCVRQGDEHGMVARRLDRQRHELPSVVGDEPGRRFMHVVLEVAQQARLVDDQVRELGQAVLGVLDAPGTRDLGSVLRRGTPERGLVHPIRLTQQLGAETEGVEHLHRAAGDAVRLADLQRAVPAVDDPRRDAGEGRELGGEQHPGRTGADDENVRRIGQTDRPNLGTRRGRLDVRIAWSVSVEVELHAAFLPCSASFVGLRHRRTSWLWICMYTVIQYTVNNDCAATLTLTAYRTSVYI